MDYNKSYFKKYDSDDYNNYTNDRDFILEKTNNNLYQIETSNNTNINTNNITNTNINTNTNTNSSDMLMFQNKVEELLLKLKYFNSNKKISTIDISEYINDKFDNVNIISEQNRLINMIDNIILKLDKKIICKGQIRRKNSSIDFEF
jgi:hypothetical protein